MNWEKELNSNITTLDDLKKVLPIEEKETLELEKIISDFPMSIPRYYLSLIHTDDPHDPIKKMSVPSTAESSTEGIWDTSGEKQNTVLEGLQHKYPQTALLLSTNRCAMYCRHCFRKRLVGQSDDEIAKMINPILTYIKEHTEINNVLISGGDALLNSNQILDYYLKELTEIEHINFIRIGTRIPVVYPHRIIKDKELLTLLKKYSSKKAIYITTQFNHVNEITALSTQCIKTLLDNGIIVSNQTVLLKGINDTADALANLFNGLTKINILPYYVFQCRPVTHVKTSFQVPLLKGCEIIKEARTKCNGYAKRFKFAMSHEKGKLEIIGKTNDTDVVFKFHQAKNPSDNEKIVIKSLQENQCWLEDL